MNSLIVVFAILAISYPILDAYSIKNEIKQSNKDVEKKSCRFPCFKIGMACICPHHDQVEDSDDQSLIENDDSSLENSVDKKKKKGCKFGCFKIKMACICPHHFHVSKAEVDEQLTCKVGCVSVGPLCLCILKTEVSEAEDSSLVNLTNYFDFSLAKKSAFVDILTSTLYSCNFGCIKKSGVCICPKKN